MTGFLIQKKFGKQPVGTEKTAEGEKSAEAQKEKSNSEPGRTAQSGKRKRRESCLLFGKKKKTIGS